MYGEQYQGLGVAGQAGGAVLPPPQQRNGTREMLNRARNELVNCHGALNEIRHLQRDQPPQAAGAPTPSGPLCLDAVTQELVQGLAELHKALCVLRDELA